MIVLDASFLVKLVLEEKGSEVAEALFKQWVGHDEQIVTVDIALSESLNALWKHYLLLKDLSLDSFKEATRDLLILWSKLSIVSTYEIAKKAVEIAINKNMTIYDSVYLSLAQKYMATLATFDTKQSKKAHELGINTYPYAYSYH